MLFAVLALISVIFGVLAGGYFLFLDKLWLSITMMTTGIVPSTFFTVMLYRYRQGWLGLAAAILAVAVAIICIIAFAGTLIAMLYLNEPL